MQLTKSTYFACVFCKSWASPVACNHFRKIAAKVSLVWKWGSAGFPILAYETERLQMQNFPAVTVCNWAPLNYTSVVELYSIFNMQVHHVQKHTSIRIWTKHCRLIFKGGSNVTSNITGRIDVCKSQPSFTPQQLNLSVRFLGSHSPSSVHCGVPLQWWSMYRWMQLQELHTSGYQPWTLPHLQL